MSFILDALQRAQKAHDSQRSVETAPILAERVTEAPGHPQTQILWITAGLLTVLSIALIAWWVGRGSAGQAPAPMPASTPPPATNNAPIARMSDTFSESVSDSASSVARQPVRALDREAARARPAPVVARAAQDAAPPAASGATTRRKAQVTIVQPEDMEAAVAQSANGNGIAPASGGSADRSPPSTVARDATRGTAQTARDPADDLPEYEYLLLNGRINLPNIRMDMHVFHNSPSRRFVFINFKKYREGDEVDGDTIVEQVTPGGAILKHRGQRFVLKPN